MTEPIKDVAVVAEPVDIKVLMEDGGSIEVVTKGGVRITLTLELLMILKSSVKLKNNSETPPRNPTKGELLRFGARIVEQRLNPYQDEIWLVWMKKSDVWQAIQSAASRMRDAMSMPDYEGWDWGWISKDGKRIEMGGTVEIPSIVGAWAKVYRNGRLPWHHELFLAEYKRDYNQFTMFAKALRDQVHRIAYTDIMGSMPTENEMEFEVEPTGEAERSHKVAKLYPMGSNESLGIGLKFNRSRADSLPEETPKEMVKSVTGEFPDKSRDTAENVTSPIVTVPSWAKGLPANK